jgi:hypothetical protein
MGNMLQLTLRAIETAETGADKALEKGDADRHDRLRRRAEILKKRIEQGSLYDD